VLAGNNWEGCVKVLFAAIWKWIEVRDPILDCHISLVDILEIKNLRAMVV